MDNGTRLTSTLVHDLFLAGVIPRRQYYQAIAYARDNTVWGQWGLRVLLALGVGQMLAGIIFFFAFNWVDLSPFAKLGLIQGGIVLCAAIAWRAGLDGLVGKASLAAAAVLVGVVLAVYGQIYQTGADAYQLFTGWTVLIIPWVLVSRNAALWLLWLLVGNIALYTFSVQIALPEGWTTWPMVHCGLGVANLLSLVAVELAVKQGTGWLENRWLRPVLLFAALVLLFIPAVNSVLGPWKLIEPV
ncbi:MAG: DUF2157 domain-containing protein, partial [Gammaproteobacteria bacterium]|nr:DUF2157 domain-containing protein [Gammaproteobacteria bacterium]